MRLRQDDSGLAADPIFGESALISTLVHADGLIRIHRQAEGLYAGETVKVIQI